MVFFETSAGNYDSACGRNLPLEATDSAIPEKGRQHASTECVHVRDRPPSCTPRAQRVGDFTAVGAGKDLGAP